MGIDITTEQDIERLRVFSELQARENQSLRRRLADAAKQLATAMHDGDPQQLLELMLREIEADLNDSSDSDSPLTSQSERRSKGSAVRKPKDKHRGHGPTEQPDLAVQEVLFELDEADRVCPECGGELKAIEGLTEDATEIDVVHVKYLLRRVKKQKYRCTCSSCQHLETALGPETPKPVQGGRYTLEFAIQVILDKYASHLPLDRQSRRMKELGLKVSSQTLWDYTWACTQWLLPSYRALPSEVLGEEVVGADETRWRLMNSNKHAKPQIIAFTSDAGVWYAFEHDKTAETVDRLLGNFSGILVADGLSIYPAVRDRRELAHQHHESAVKPFTLAQCWAHARRNYVKASRGDPQAEEMLALIAQLYQLKRACKDEVADEWLAWTDAVLRRMRRWMAEQRPRPSSQLAQAIRYMDKRWKGLTLFRDNPAIWLDNNGTERALRLAVQGRKNHYGSRSENGMLAAAALYSLIETCHRLGIRARAYLREALTRSIRNPGTAYTPAMYLADLNA